MCTLVKSLLTQAGEEASAGREGFSKRQILFFKPRLNRRIFSLILLHMQNKLVKFCHRKMLGGFNCILIIFINI